MVVFRLAPKVLSLWAVAVILSLGPQQHNQHSNAVGLCEAFSSSHNSNNGNNRRFRQPTLQRRLLLRLQQQDDPGRDEDNATTATNDLFFTTQQQGAVGYGSLFADAEIVDLELLQHRPLGCTVEESLGKSGKYVFISKVKEGGNAQKGGLRVGDVILACSDVFGSELMPIVDTNDDDNNNTNDDDGSGNKEESMMDTVLDLIGARPDSEGLELRVARGTPVLQQHEAALVDLCSNPGASQTEIEDCLMDFLKESYTLPEVEMMDGSSSSEEEECSPEEDDDCLLDSAFDLWNQEMDYGTSQQSKDKNGEESEKQKKPKAKPWSSRSSPSGTFVRDPKTGKLINLDA
mmetsp:Transcript_12547/g.34806  ORF Transcript_12547/g.34806 Transcript_12547/m.34806 type:complete len:347 (+) Transcript_12547:199-1239(+)